MKEKSLLKGLVMPVLFCACCYTSCKKESPNISSSPKASLGLSIKGNDQIIEKSSMLKSTSADDFQVEIYAGDGTLRTSYSRLADVPSSIELDAGEYYVTAFSKNHVTAAFDNPYYFGQSDHFALAKGEQKTISVQCYIANAKLTVVYSDNVKANFVDYQVIASHLTDSLVFAKDDARAAYFDPGKIDVQATLTYTKSDGTSQVKTIKGSISAAIARKHYELYVDASKDLGTSTLNVTVVDSMETETVMLTETSTAIKTASELVQGDILVTEVMPNPDKVADELGEWIELYNNTTSNVNLNGLVVKVGTKSLTIPVDYTLQPGGYAFVCKDSQGGAGAIYYYGTALTLVNSNGSIQLYNSALSTAVLLSQVSYTTSPTGASLSLDPVNFSFTLASDIASWCTATEAYSTGDKGTPGTANPACN